MSKSGCNSTIDVKERKKERQKDRKTDRKKEVDATIDVSSASKVLRYPNSNTVKPVYDGT
jgi:hypothetical protein